MVIHYHLWVGNPDPQTGTLETLTRKPQSYGNYGAALHDKKRETAADVLIRVCRDETCPDVHDATGREILIL